MCWRAEWIEAARSEATLSAKSGSTVPICRPGLQILRDIYCVGGERPLVLGRRIEFRACFEPQPKGPLANYPDQLAQRASESI